MFPSHYARNITVLGVFSNFYWLWNFIKHFVDLLVCMCLLAGWPLDFGLRVYVDEFNVCCNNKQEYVVMEHTSTICKINKMIDKPQLFISDFIHNNKTYYNEDVNMEFSSDGSKIEDRSFYKMIQSKTTIILQSMNIPWIPIQERYGCMKCQPPIWKMPRRVETMKTLNNLALLWKTSKFYVEYVEL